MRASIFGFVELLSASTRSDRKRAVFAEESPASSFVLLFSEVPAVVDQSDAPDTGTAPPGFFPIRILITFVDLLPQGKMAVLVFSRGQRKA